MTSRDYVLRLHSGHVYVVLFSTGALKVGQTKDAAKRSRQYAYAAGQQGSFVTKTWTSPRHTTVDENEQNLISFCLKRYGEPIQGREAFAGADFDEVVTYAESLSCPAMTDEEIQRVMGVYQQAADRGSRGFRDHQVADLATEVELISGLANELNRASSCEAAFSIAERMALLYPAPWTRTDPSAATDYLTRRSGKPASPTAAREFEVSARALFALAHARMPAAFDELAAFMNAVAAT